MSFLFVFQKYHFVEMEEKKMKYIASNFYSCKYSAEPVVYEMHCDQLQMVYPLYPIVCRE